MNSIKTYLKISRYRFWAYTAGPFAIGSILGVTNLSNLFTPTFFILLVFFLIPFNFFIYSVNDYFDKDTDQFNSKKDEKETRYSSRLKNILKWGLLTFLVYWLIAFISLNSISKFLLILVTLISFFYSAPPLRFKAKPFIDSFSNILYAIPGFIAFQLFSNNTIPFEVIFIAIAYTSAMHLFSAVPDIEADKKAGLKTTAVILGRKLSLILCLLFWFSITALTLNTNILISILSLIYPFMALVSILRPNLLVRVYWLFPYVNTFVGFCVFWIIVINRF